MVKTWKTMRILVRVFTNFLLSISLMVLITGCQSPGESETEEAKRQQDSILKAITSDNQADAQDKEVKFLWRADQFNAELDAEVSVLVLNEDYLDTIRDPERAALGYVATFTGNECRWDGKPTDSRSNLKCTILSALDLGYQCSDTHLGFLRKWFATDSAVLKNLGGCPTIPETATIQSSFDSINLRRIGDSILVRYTVSGFNMRESKAWTRESEDLFLIKNQTIQLISSEKSEPVVEKYEQEVY